MKSLSEVVKSVVRARALPIHQRPDALTLEMIRSVLIDLTIRWKVTHVVDANVHPRLNSSTVPI